MYIFWHVNFWPNDLIPSHGKVPFNFILLNGKPKDFLCLTIEINQIITSVIEKLGEQTRRKLIQFYGLKSNINVDLIHVIKQIKQKHWQKWMNIHELSMCGVLQHNFGINAFARVFSVERWGNNSQQMNKDWNGKAFVVDWWLCFVLFVAIFRWMWYVCDLRRNFVEDVSEPYRRMRAKMCALWLLGYMYFASWWDFV